MRHNPSRGHARCDGHGAHAGPDWFAGLWHAIGRHRRGHDPFGGGGPFGGRGGRGGFGDFGDDGMPRGRQFSCGPYATDSAGVIVGNSIRLANEVESGDALG